MQIEKIFKIYKNKKTENYEIIDDHLVKKIEVTTNQGWHARPSTIIASTTNKYKSNVYVTKKDGDENFNAKSVVSLLLLAAKYKEATYFAYDISGENSTTLQKNVELAKQNLEEIIQLQKTF